MDSDTIYSELINIGDSQNYTNDLIKKNSDKLDKISERVSREQEPPVVVVPDTVEIRNLPEVQKVEVINTEQTDLSTVEGLISELIDVLPSIKDEELAVSIVKLTEAIKQDQSKEKVVELLRAILDKESPSFEIPDELKSKEGRIKVEVDRVGSFTNMGALTTEQFNTKQDELIGAINNIGGAQAYSKLVDDAGSYIYIGEAAPGSDESDPVWRIQRIDLTSDPDVEILWAGTDFTNQWDDRVSLIYS